MSESQEGPSSARCRPSRPARKPEDPIRSKKTAKTRSTRSMRTFDRSKLLLRLDLTFPADVQEIGPVVNRVMQLTAEKSCAKGKEFEVELSLHEALVNAIKHGCRFDATKEVQLTVHCDETRGMLLIVRDPGQGFDVKSLPSPLVGDRVYASHGRGIYMINRMMDEVRFRKKGSEIHMRKR
jgi:serine/threonine-protein kinase RsbW